MDCSPQAVRFDATTLWHLDAAEWAIVHSIKLVSEDRYVIGIDGRHPFAQVVCVILAIRTVIALVGPCKLGSDTQTLANITKICIKRLRSPNEVHAHAQVGVADEVMLRFEVNPGPNILLVQPNLDERREIIATREVFSRKAAVHLFHSPLLQKEVCGDDAVPRIAHE